MTHKRQIGIGLALLIGSILVVVLTVNNRTSQDSGDIAVAMDTGEKKSPITDSNTEMPSSVNDRDVLVSDLEELTWADANPRRWEREVLDVAVNKGRKEAALQRRYQSLKRQAQSVHGSVIVPDGLKGKGIGPIKLQLRTAHGYAKVGETMLDRDGHYAFDPVAPGKYTLLIFETEANPGINYKNIEVHEDQVLSDLDIPLASGVIAVYLLDESGDAISGARVTVGKANRPSGSNLDVFTFRIGTSDADGCFVAPNLTDGQYVVKASYGQIETAEVVALEPQSKTEHTLSLRTSGSQIVGAVRRRDPLVNTSYPVILEGMDSTGNRIVRAINTDSKGQYAISYLPPGTYTVYIQQTAQFSGTDAIVEITEEKETRRNVDLDVYYPKEWSSIAGKVSNTGNSPGSMLHVLVTSENGVLRSPTVVNMDSGDFSVKALPPGRYTVKVMSTDENGNKTNELSSKSVYVEPNGSIIRMDVSLPPRE